MLHAEGDMSMTSAAVGSAPAGMGGRRKKKKQIRGGGRGGRGSGRGGAATTGGWAEEGERPVPMLSPTPDTGK